MEELVCRPRHSLLHQALHADEAKMVTNGDGFGIGWYGERPQPAIYRDTMPAWSDENLPSLCATVRSPLFFAHVRAATGTPTVRQNCHPFRHGRHLFMHNGQVGGFAQLRRALEAQLPDALYLQRQGGTDSELLFLLIIARIEAGEDAESAVLQVYEHTALHMAEAGIRQPLRFTAVLSDGQALHAFRLASDDKPPTLYLRQQAQGVAVASEALDDSGEWQALPAGTVLVSRDGRAQWRQRPQPAALPAAA